MIWLARGHYLRAKSYKFNRISSYRSAKSIHYRYQSYIEKWYLSKIRTATDAITITVLRNEIIKSTRLPGILAHISCYGISRRR